MAGVDRRYCRQRPLLHGKMHGRHVNTYSEEVLREGRKGIICVLKFFFSV